MANPVSLTGLAPAFASASVFIQRKPRAFALALYLLLALLFFGLPAIDDPTGEVISAEEIEPSAFQWFLAWWPDAILDGRNLFLTEDIYPPEGRNLAWVTSIPGPALLLAPITLTAGPVAAYNLLSLAAPPLAAFTAFLLVRHVTRSFWPSIAAGYLFGFSGIVVYHAQGVPNLSTVALVPLFVLLVIRHVQGSLRTRWFVILGALLTAAQYSISSETLAMTIFFGGIAILFALWQLPQRRAALWRTVRAIPLAFLAAGVILSPFLFYVFFEPALKPEWAVPETFSSDLLSFVIPTGVQELAGGRAGSLVSKFGGDGAPFGGGGSAYVGLPLLAIVIWFAVERWRSRTARVMIAMVVVTAVATLGPRLHVAGERTIPLPWRPLVELPLLEYALPHRFAVFTALGIALIVGVWLAGRQTAARWLLVVAAVAFLVPNFGSGRWNAEAPTPSFIADGGYERHLSNGDVVFIWPNFGPGSRWHAETGMAFVHAGGYVGRIPSDYERMFGRLPELAAAPSPAAVRELESFLGARGVTAIMLDERQSEHYGKLFQAVGGEPRRSGGVLLYRLRPAGVS